MPKVEWELTARDVLTLEWIDGISLSDLAALRAAGHDLPALARRLMQSFLRQALRDGFFHADMHQGNLFVDAAGDIVAVDFGIMGRLGAAGAALPRRDPLRLHPPRLPPRRRGAFRGRLRARAPHSVDDFAQAIRAIGEPIHGQQASDISMARLLTLLFEVTELFDMADAARAAARAEDDGGGRGRGALARPRVRHVGGVRAGGRATGSSATSARPASSRWRREGVGALGRLAGELPRLAERAERLSAEFAEMGERGIRLDPETIDEIGRSEARGGRWGRVALWVIAVGRGRSSGCSG